MAVEFQQKERYQVGDLLEIMRLLRGEGGCPWDRAQTHASIKRDLLEETYEVLEAIDRQDAVLLQEELGDLLLQVVSHAAMEEEQGVFCFDDVADGICKKLIVRHPHVFGAGVASTPDEVLDRWDQIKRETKGQATYTETLESVPKVFPALMRAEKLQKRTGKAGLPQLGVQETLERLTAQAEALQLQEDPSRRWEQMGELLFTAVAASRALQVEPEESLGAACERFLHRFERMEKLCNSRGVDMKTGSIEQLDRLWNEANQNNG